MELHDRAAQQHCVSAHPESTELIAVVCTAELEYLNGVSDGCAAFSVCFDDQESSAAVLPPLTLLDSSSRSSEQ